MDQPWLMMMMVLLLGVVTATTTAELCDVTSGQAIIILDITESLDNQVDQPPLELPLEGVSGVEVDVVMDDGGGEYFTLTGTTLALNKPLDRDQGTSTIRFQVTCSVIGGERTATIPVIVRVTDINDNPPVFSGLPYSVTIPEVQPVGSTIFKNVVADDLDAGENGQVVYSIVPNGGETDGYGYFSINLPHQGLVTVNRSLDYERSSLYYLTILASDRAEASESRLSSTATLTVNIADSDDQDPVFEYASCPRVGSICANPEYAATVTSGKVSGVLSVRPEKIHAADQDSLATPVKYTLMSGRPATFGHYFSINPDTGAVTHTSSVDRAITSQFDITVKAEEASAARRFATARLVITVAGVDTSPPVVTASSYTGTVDENSAPGTPVYDDNPLPQPILLSVSDPDLASDEVPARYTWELTTTAFTVGDGGRLEVAQDSTLDRDPPNPGLYTFQVVAREAWEGGVASAPITLTVVLNDVNDNPPRLPVYPPLAVQAGAARRVIYQISAKDTDAGENAEVIYSIEHVSNRGGRDKFSINGTTGELALVGEVAAGEQYSVTIRATDNGGLYTQSILEVLVNRGPNTGGPLFTVPRYSATVSEGAPLKSALITLSALDPEGDDTRFSFVDDQSEFDIGGNSGTIRVVGQLDRERQDSYTLVVKAEDPEGMYNTATVSVIIQDINDKNPEFIGLPYSFRVSEGQEDAEVGTVSAVDDDAEENGEVFYSVPEDSAFIIAADTGAIKTKQALDYEKQQVHYLVVTAQDGASDPRLATSTVTVLVSDTGDEPPVFAQQVYQATIQENMPETTLLTVVASDPDTVPVITYVMVNGDSDLFSVDGESGDISTTRGLDYEAASRHTIVVGTQENTLGGPQSTCSVLVTVEDANDNPPVFSLSVPPRSLPEASPPGTLVVTLLASDADGTRPNNVVEYELTGYGRGPDFFAIEQDSGVITLKADLTAERESDFELEIVARDGGSPGLTTTSTVSISVERRAGEEESEPPEDLWAAFSDTQFSVEVPEDTPVGNLVKRLTVLNSPTAPVGLRCVITEGNNDEKFMMEVTSEGHCGLLLQTPLDYESLTRYALQIQLDAPISPNGTEIRMAQVDISVIDVNDNKPEFIFTPPYSDIRHKKYFGFVTEDSTISTSVLQISAEDKDSGEFGRVEYELVPESNRGGYFSVGRTTGLLQTEREMTSVPQDLLPFNLTLRAHDNPKADPSLAHITSVTVIVNLVEENHRLVLVAEATPAQVKDRQDQLLAVLQEHSNQVIGIEKIESRRYLGNGSIMRDSSSSDIWFHVVDTDTGALLHRHHPHIIKLSKGEPDRTTLLYHVTAALGGSRASDIRPPILVQPVSVSPVPPARAGIALEGFQVALMVLAGVIVILGMAGICYICVQWKRYVRHRAEANKAVVVVAPPYERVGSVSEPVTKEYEVQVLHMSVPMDDESVQDMTIDSRHSHHFSMDNVSYITKQQLSEDSSSGGGSSGGEVGGEGLDLTPRGHHDDDNLDWDPHHHHHPYHHHQHHHLPPSSTPGRNPAYDNFAEDDSTRDGPLSVSVTNENVLFGRRGLTDPSPVQTTTEL